MGPVCGRWCMPWRLSRRTGWRRRWPASGGRSWPETADLPGLQQMRRNLDPEIEYPAPPTRHRQKEGSKMPPTKRMELLVSQLGRDDGPGADRTRDQPGAIGRITGPPPWQLSSHAYG